MSLKIGEAFDITVKPTLVSSENIGKDITEYMMVFDLKNASGKEASVRVFQTLSAYSNDYQFLSESQTGKMPRDSVRYWDVKIPAQGSSQLSFMVRENRR